MLAIAVALSHMGVTFLGGHNPGVVAVISFFLISGFVMTGLVRAYYAEYRKVPLFYMDRIARIFPQYFLFLLLAVTGYFFLGFSSSYLASISFAGFLANLVVVPLDFYMYSPSIEHCTFIPQAWSLGLELMFYLLFPFILLGGRRNIWLVLSLIVWLIAAFGFVDTDAWGYRLLPGTLFIFLLGSYVFDCRIPSLKHPAIAVLALMTGCAALLYGTGKMVLPYNFEVLLGLLIGVPALFFLARCARNKWDDWLGNLSYGVYLCHLLVIWVFESFDAAHGASSIMLMTAASVTLAYFGYAAVEHPVMLWRRGRRRGAARV